MTRRLQPCRTCPPPDDSDPELYSRFKRRRGKTRHRDGVCGQCRAEARYLPPRSRSALDPARDLETQLRRVRTVVDYRGRGG